MFHTNNRFVKLNRQLVRTIIYKKGVKINRIFTLLNYNSQYFFNFHTDLNAQQKDLTDLLCADVVTLGARAIYNATEFLLDECGPDRRVADLQRFGNFRRLRVLPGGCNGSQIERADMFKSSYIAPIDADTDNKDPPEKECNWQICPRKTQCTKAV